MRLHVLGLSMLLSSAALLPPGIDDVVTFESGKARGQKVASEGLRYWLGVPYADTTAGTNAFLPPKRRPQWNGTFDATAFGPACAQSGGGDLDCLILDIMAPVLPPGTKVPVMVYIHGGSFTGGNAQGYQGSNFPVDFAVEHKLVSVSIQYRLGALGWMYTGVDGVNGNMGLLDQIAALEWVQRNIAIVGGDPTQVTVFGESAGAISISVLLTVPRAKGLFHKAITESSFPSLNMKNSSEAVLYGQSFCSVVDCSGCSLACLQALDTDTVISTWQAVSNNANLVNKSHLWDAGLTSGPTRDGHVLPIEPMAAVEGGQYWGAQAQVPVLMGTTTDDALVFVLPQWPQPLSPAETQQALTGYFSNGTIAALLMQYYNVSSNYPDGRVPLARITTDYLLRCSGQRYLAAAVAAGANAWSYRYAHVFSNPSFFPSEGFPAICSTAVCHTAEMPFVFNVLPQGFSFTAAEQTLADTMGSFWATFARTGDPNPKNSTTAGAGMGAGAWPAWDPVNRAGIVLDTPITAESTADLCGFWDSIAEGYSF